MAAASSGTGNSVGPALSGEVRGSDGYSSSGSPLRRLPPRLLDLLHNLDSPAEVATKIFDTLCRHTGLDGELT